MPDKEPAIEYPYFITSVWGGTPDDPNLEGAVNAVLSGVTSTHIADTYYTTNEEYFKEAKGAGIPAKEFVDANGTTAYEIHFSFGPDNNGFGSMLDDSYLTNCLNAQLITPVSENDLKNNENYKTNKVNSNLDLLKIFTRKIYLYPLFNCTNPAELEKDDTKAFDAAIHKALEKYVQSDRDDKSRSTYFKEVDAALTQLQKSRDPNYGVEGREMTKNQFLYWFNQNIGTIGLEPKTKVKTALISEKQSKKEGKKGFVEERYVKEMVRIKHSMDGKRYSGAMSFFNPLIRLLYSYNFVLLNCSHTVNDIHLKSANDSLIRDELKHTIGWNDIEKVTNSIKQYGFFSEKTRFAMARLISGVLELITMRAVETPANSVYNLKAANKVRDTLNQEAVGQKPKPQPAPKVVPAPKVANHHKPELKPRLSVHSKPGHSLTLKLQNTSLKGLVENAEKSKVAMQLFFDQDHKPIAAVFYSDKEKNVPIATVDLKPNNSNTVNIKFGDLPLDQHQILALLRVLGDVKINKDSDKPVIFTIEHKQALHDAKTLQNGIEKVFGKDSLVKMKAAEPGHIVRQHKS